ncbi:MAG: radical SAM protein, partial [Propionibacteriales bacterium]|nr:radical SAM protein [Propionibacteriales bacterium]
MEFYEVTARSVINRVPGESRVPFRWTINPYRGCGHACVYCMSGDTRILTADGRTKPLTELRIGDRIYGTRREDRYRRYVLTTVWAHWSTIRPAYRVLLEDGTELVAGGDHRFLTDRGWKHVTGSQHGSSRRPHLTDGVKLLGIGQFAAHPAETKDYRIGYLCGMIRGDAHLGAYSYERRGRSNGAIYRFRLALADVEAIERTEAYLATFGVVTDRFGYSPEMPQRRAITAIRTSRRAAFERITELVGWPTAPSADWAKGFLAGVFDAEGSCSRGVWRISNTDPEIIEAIGLALKRFGFRYVVEDPGRRNGIRVIRLLGGLAERLRFFHTVDPAIVRKRAISGTPIKAAAALRVVSVEPTGFDLRLYDITTGTGDFIADGVVSHNCFARKSHTYLDLDAGHDFDSRIIVKVNAPELLRRELARPTWSGEHIAMGTNTDPYQRAEGRYRLMPGIIEE